MLIVYQSDGQGAQPPPQPAGMISVAMVSRSKHHTVRGIHSRRKERQSRLPVQASRISRMATTARHFRANPVPFPLQRDRSFRIQGQCPVTPVHLVATRTILKRYRRVHSRLATRARLCVSTVCSHQPSPPSSAARSQFVGSGNTSVERSAVVSEPVSHNDCPSCTSPESPGSPAGPSGEQPSSGHSERAPSLRVACLRSIHARENLPQAVSDLLLAVWRQGTACHCDSVWAIWNHWCRGRAIDQFSPRLSNILEFLADEFNLDKSYRTVSGYCTALSSVLPPIDGRPIGSHPSVCQLMCDVYNLHPPKPRHSWTWEVGDVLDHLQSWGPSNSLTDRRLTLRLTMLLALAGAWRSSELAATSPPLRREASSVIIPLRKSTKAQRAGEPLRQLSCAAFPKMPNLCPTDHLRVYEERSAPWRSDASGPLLLSFRLPHGPVASSTVARWLHTVLKESGVDTTSFAAHSTRGAATSAAAKAGVSVEAILASADWRRASTFRRFTFEKTWPRHKQIFKQPFSLVNQARGREIYFCCYLTLTGTLFSASK